MLRKSPPEHRASRAAEPEPPPKPLDAPHEWLCLAVPFRSLSRDGKAWRALRKQFRLCGYSLRADGVLESIGDKD